MSNESVIFTENEFLREANWDSVLEWMTSDTSDNDEEAIAKLTRTVVNIDLLTTIHNWKIGKTYTDLKTRAKEMSEWDEDTSELQSPLSMMVDTTNKTERCIQKCSKFYRSFPDAKKVVEIAKKGIMYSVFTEMSRVDPLECGVALSGAIDSLLADEISVADFKEIIIKLLKPVEDKKYPVLESLSKTSKKIKTLISAEYEDIKVSLSSEQEIVSTMDEETTNIYNTKKGEVIEQVKERLELLDEETQALRTFIQEYEA